MIDEVIGAAKVFSTTIEFGKEKTIEELENAYPMNGKKLFYLLPIAFGWIVLHRLGMNEFPTSIKFRNCEISTKTDKLFVSCLKAANSAMKEEFKSISLDDFDVVLSYGAEGKIASQLFKDGQRAEGAKLASPVVDDEL